MELYILRHGTAEPEGGSGDAARALTKDGREKLGLVLARARAAGVTPSLILTSPLVRAVETAELAAETLAPAAAVMRTDALVPGSTPQTIWEEVRRHSDEASVMLVGHEPLLGETISYLLGAPRVVVDLKKGAMARIDVDADTRRPAGLLVWLLTPRAAK